MTLPKYATRDSQKLHDIVKVYVQGGQELYDIAKACLQGQPGTARQCQSMLSGGGQDLHGIVKVRLQGQPGPE